MAARHPSRRKIQDGFLHPRPPLPMDCYAFWALIPTKGKEEAEHRGMTEIEGVRRLWKLVN